MKTTPPFELGNREAVIVQCHAGHEHILMTRTHYKVKVDGKVYDLELGSFAPDYKPIFYTDGIVGTGEFMITIMYEQILESQGR